MGCACIHVIILTQKRLYSTVLVKNGHTRISTDKQLVIENTRTVYNIIGHIIDVIKINKSVVGYFQNTLTR